MAFGVLGAAIVGWEIGTWLSEKFEIVRKAGIFMVEVLMKGVEHLRYQWEMFAAIFTTDTIAEATKRHEERLAEMNRIFGEMYADATEGANAAKGAMDTAATAAEEIAKRLEAVRLGTQEAVGRGIEAVHGALEKLKGRLGEVEQAVGKAQGVVNDATAKMAEAYKGFTAIVEANLQAQITAVKARYEQEKAELERTQQSETAKITKSTQLLTDALTQQATLRRQATTDTLGLIDQETQARKDAAARQGQTEAERAANVQRVENDILATKRQTLSQALSEYRQHVDTQAVQGKQGVADAIDRIRQSEDILNKALDAEAKAHQTAAQAALSARDQIRQTLEQTQTQIDQITAKLKDGLKVTLDADTTRFDKAIADLDKALAEKQYLLQIQADLQEAEKKLKEYEALLKEGKTLPVDADVSKAKEALERLKVYADQNAQFELKVATEKAQAAITNVEGMINALNRIQTESRHQVSTNADAARAEIMSLNGANTSSTHTIYVQKVEVNATGGLVGGGVQRFADGGAVAPAFPRMAGGSVPGSGHHDTVPRTLDAGAVVIRKAAVQKYGGGALARLAGIATGGVARFAKGGPVTPQKPKRNRDVVEAEKMIDLGLQGLGQISYSGSLDARSKTFAYWQPLARQDRLSLEKMIDRKTLTANERASLDQIKQRWRFAMAQPMIYGKDLERDLIDYMETLDGEFFARGGLAKSDTVPAMLTPGEYVVNRSAVARLGVGFFEAINNLSAPAQSLAGRTMAGIQGFASGGIVSPIGSSLLRPTLPADGTPARTVRVELAAGANKVNATVDARDEARLLQLLDAARARTA